jgi:hypothetical protein
LSNFRARDDDELAANVLAQPFSSSVLADRTNIDGRRQLMRGVKGEMDRVSLLVGASARSSEAVRIVPDSLAWMGYCNVAI